MSPKKIDPLRGSNARPPCLCVALLLTVFSVYSFLQGCGATVSYLTLCVALLFTVFSVYSFLHGCGATVSYHQLCVSVWRYSLQFPSSLQSFRLPNSTTVSYRQLRVWCYILQFTYSFLCYFVSTVVCNIACGIGFSSGTGIMICGMAAD